MPGRSRPRRRQSLSVDAREMLQRSRQRKHTPGVRIHRRSSSTRRAWRRRFQWQAVELRRKIPTRSSRRNSRSITRPQARSQAERFLNVTLATAERTWQALAWEANARVAIAQRDLARAKGYIGKALSTIEGYEAPLADWRAHATAAELYAQTSKMELTQHHLELSRATILKLANSMVAEEPLAKVFLSAPLVRNVFAGDVEVRSDETSAGSGSSGSTAAHAPSGSRSAD